MSNFENYPDFYSNETSKILFKVRNLRRLRRVKGDGSQGEHNASLPSARVSRAGEINQNNLGRLRRVVESIRHDTCQKLLGDLNIGSMLI